jgi:magnesium transporter
VNGLVYFDQFSLIPPVHLGLVVLGIFVLLGGVWVVSIYSGGRGVDVGTWNEGDDFSCQESILLPDSTEGLESDTREATPMSMAKQPSPPAGRPVAMKRETLSESDIPNMAIFPQTVRSELDDPAQDSSSVLTMEIHRPQALQISGSQLPSQRSVPHCARRGPARWPSTSTHSGISRTVTQPHPLSTQLPPLGPVSSLGTGFQIGLSPSSPGFAIVPLDRRRRPSGMPSLADVANDIIVSLREAERRTVSEGGLTRTLLNEVQDVSRDNGAAVREDHTERNVEDGIDERRDQFEARRRWSWIRKVFIGKD